MFFESALTQEFLDRINLQTTFAVLSKNEIKARSDSAILISQFKKTAEIVCRNLIGQEYLDPSKENAFSENPRFDLAILYELNANMELIEPIAFVLVEYGECHDLPLVWSVNLICSKLESKGIKGLGQILMGLYLFTIYRNPSVEDKRAVLELSNFYINISGLASYSKLGFVVDERLLGPNCFSTYENLPMIVDFVHQQIDDSLICDILTGKGDPFRKPTKPVICRMADGISSLTEEHRKTRLDLQLYLGICKTLELFIRNGKITKKKIKDYYELADERYIHFLFLYKLLLAEYNMYEPTPLSNHKRKANDKISFIDWFNLKVIREIEQNYTEYTTYPEHTSRFPGFELLYSTRQQKGIVEPLFEELLGVPLIAADLSLRRTLRPSLRTESVSKVVPRYSRPKTLPILPPRESTSKKKRRGGRYSRKKREKLI